MYYLDHAVMEEISDPRNSSVFVFVVEFGYLVFDDFLGSGATFFVVTKLNVTFTWKKNILLINLHAHDFINELHLIE